MELKTKQSQASVKEFISSIRDVQIREDSRKIISLMQAATKAKPKMWGESIVGFGTSTLKYADGSEREWMKLSFSPRKQKITLYLPVFARRKGLEAMLGKYVSTRACLHIKKLSDVHIPSLIRLLKESAQQDDCGCL